LISADLPAAEKKAEIAQTVNTFEAVAKEWLDGQPLADVTRAKAEWIFGLVSDIGPRPIAELTPPEVLQALRKIEAEGHLETAHRAKQRIGQVMRYAIATGRAGRDGTADLRGALSPVVTTNRASLHDKVYGKDVLQFAYLCCKSNGGAAGVDGQEFNDIESYGRERWLGELAQELREKKYRKHPTGYSLVVDGDR
jgi:integrase